MTDPSDIEVVREALELMFDIDEQERAAGLTALARIEARLAKAEQERDAALTALEDAQDIATSPCPCCPGGPQYPCVCPDFKCCPRCY